MRETPNVKRDYFALGQALKEEWERLCMEYLPIRPKKSVWRYSRQITSGEPTQGWKIHISATILSAASILRKVAPLLASESVLFKGPRSLQELSRINSGLFYGFSQVGKFITIYAKDAKDATSLARRLHLLTYRFSGPAVPYDNAFRQHGCIYYRYGSFAALKMKDPNGVPIPAIQNPEGKLVPDYRKPGAAIPDWVGDPFRKAEGRHIKRLSNRNPLKSTIKAYEVLSQRGKGGVYRALDLSMLPARLCILKEGRRHGETDWDGRDGYWRVKHEADVLESLYSAGVKVARVYRTFEVENHSYLVMEFVKGRNLQELIESGTKKIPLPQALRYAKQLADLINKIHRAGWAWRDCKPLNLILSENGVLRPLDFEGACRVDTVDPMPWGTGGYVPPEWHREPVNGTREPEDLYALGATMHHILSGESPDKRLLLPIGSLRRRVPPIVREIVSALLSPNPELRPDALTVSRALKAVCSEFPTN